MVVVTVTCTDRQGRRLATRRVEGWSFQETAAERLKIYEAFKAEYIDHAGVEPYIFTETNSV